MEEYSQPNKEVWNTFLLYIKRYSIAITEKYFIN